MRLISFMKHLKAYHKFFLWNSIVIVRIIKEHPIVFSKRNLIVDEF